MRRSIIAACPVFPYSVLRVGVSRRSQITNGMAERTAIELAIVRTTCDGNRARSGAGHVPGRGGVRVCYPARRVDPSRYAYVEAKFGRPLRDGFVDFS